MPTEAVLTNAASELRTVLGRLARRLRTDTELPLSHVAVLSRLDRNGPQTTSALAASEHMRPQSMATIVGELQAGGLVTRVADPTDGRKLDVELTDAGRGLLAGERARRDGWLANAIADELDEPEQELLVEAVALLRRIAEL